MEAGQNVITVTTILIQHAGEMDKEDKRRSYHGSSTKEDTRMMRAQTIATIDDLRGSADAVGAVADLQAETGAFEPDDAFAAADNEPTEDVGQGIETAADWNVPPVDDDTYDDLVEVEPTVDL